MCLIIESGTNLLSLFSLGESKAMSAYEPVLLIHKVLHPPRSHFLCSFGQQANSQELLKPLQRTAKNIYSCIYVHVKLHFYLIQPDPGRGTCFY